MTIDLARESTSRSISRRSQRPRRAPSVERPRVSKPLFKLFSRYARGYLRKHFHAVRMSGASQPLNCDGQPVIVVLNHPAWWDPLLAILVASHLWPQREHFGPIDSAALARYRFFEKLGFFGVERGTRAGRRQFLGVCEAVLADANSCLWITAQGEFVDPRLRPVTLRPGIGHVVAAAPRGIVIPLALEYAFWTERLPEALVRFGEPMEFLGEQRSPREWTDLIARRLQETQDALAAESIQRDPARFKTLVSGSAGIGGVYDLWRRAKAAWQGEAFRAEHGASP